VNIPTASTNWGPSNNNLRQTPDVKSDPEIRIAVINELRAAQ
jgi:hypothetical protein